MKQLLPYQPYQIVIERQYQTEQPQRFILFASTKNTVAEVLIDFYKKSIEQIDETLNRVNRNYPQLFNV